MAAQRQFDAGSAPAGVDKLVDAARRIIQLNEELRHATDSQYAPRIGRLIDQELVPAMRRIDHG